MFFDRLKGSSIDIIEVVKFVDFVYIIVGGIIFENVDKYLNLNLVGIDISLGIEIDGFKDFVKMKKIIDKVNKYKVGEIKNG